MKNNGFLKVELNARNELRTFAEFKIFEKQFYCDSVKIDTGCPKTTILTSGLAISKSESKRLKDRDIADKSVQKRYSLGVNDTLDFKKRTKELFLSREYEKMINVSFRHIASNFSLGGIELGDIPVMVNYDRIGNILIGMDVLRLLETHMKACHDDNLVFLGCHKDRLSSEFDSEIKTVFGLVREKENQSYNIAQTI